MAYHQFETDDGPYGSFEVFYSEGETLDDGEELGAGWYWWACLPGCLPDGEPCGPFKTAAEAIADAQQIE